MRPGTSQKIAVLGGGSWGTTLSVLLNSKGHEVRMWEFVARRAETMRVHRENEDMLPGVRIPEEITVTSCIERASVGSSAIVLAVPSHALRDTATKLAPLLKDDMIVVIATKGIEEGTLKRMSEVVVEVLGLDRVE